MTITNYSKNEYVEKLVRYGLQVLGMDKKEPLIIRIKQFIKPVKQGEYTIHALIQPIPELDKVYDLYFSPEYTFKSELREWISHELVHLQQYVTGQLKIDGKKVVFKGVEYEYGTYDENSPWEREARSKQSKIATEIRKKLNGK